MSKRLTNSEIQNKLNSIYHDRIRIIGHYKDANTRTMFECNHHHKFTIALASLIRGKKGCPKCRQNKKYDRKLYKKYGNTLKRLDDLNGYYRIKFECNHHHIFKRNPEEALKKGCPTCRKIKKYLRKINKSTDGKIHPQDLYRDYHGASSRIVLICNHGHKFTRTLANVARSGAVCQKCKIIRHGRKLKHILTKKNIILESPFKNVKKRVKLKCLNCGHEWFAMPDDLFRGRGCPICNNHDMNDYVFRKRLSKVSHNQIKECKQYHYQGFKHPTKFICHNGHTFINIPKNILRNPVCKRCNRIKKHHDFILKDKQLRHNLFKMHHGYIKEDINHHYHGYHRKTLLICKKGHQWWATPDKLMSGEGCPYYNNSHGEMIVQHELEKMNLKHCSSRKMLKKYPNAYKHSFRVYIEHHLLSIDFMTRINGKHYAIEFDGIQHFKPVDFSGELTKEQTRHNFKKQKCHDHLKSKWCSNYHIKMVRIENIHNYHYGKKMIKLVKTTLNQELPTFQESLF